MSHIRSDKELVESALQGQRDAFGLLVERYERPVHAVTIRILHDLHLAQDAAQDAFVTAYRNLRRLRDANSVGPWLLKIARNRALRMAKDRRRIVVESTASNAPAASNGRLDERSAFLLEILDRLPAHERVVVMLRYFDNHDVETIAQITARPVGTITKQLSRAHHRLRRILEDKR